MFMYCAQGLEYLSGNNLVSEYSSLEEFKSTLKELRRKYIKFPKEIIDYAASQWLHSPRWHKENSTFEEINEAVKRGVSTSWWEELLNAGFDITEAEYICRLNNQLINAFSTYFITSNWFEVLKKMFDMYGVKMFRIKEVKHLYAVITTFVELNNPPRSFNMLLDLATIRKSFSITDDTIEILKKYGKERTLKYLVDGYKTVNSIEFYKKFHDYSFLWHGEQIGVMPILGSLTDVDITKIEKLSTPPEMFDSVLRARIPIYGPVKAIQMMSEFKGMPSLVAKYIYEESVENPESEFTKYDYINEMTQGKLDKYFIRIPSSWEDWILIEWLINKLNNSEETMTKDRIVHGPAGQTKTFRYLNILDEVKPEDLVNGVKTKPDKVFERSAKRIELEMKSKMGEDVKLPKAPWKDTREVKQLLHSDDLKMESKIMSNCVSGYIRACITEKTYIYHVGISDYKSGATMEVTPDKKILQLYEAGNQSARKQLVDMMEDWIKKNGGNFQVQLQG